MSSYSSFDDGFIGEGSKVLERNFLDKGSGCLSRIFARRLEDLGDNGAKFTDLVFSGLDGGVEMVE